MSTYSVTRILSVLITIGIVIVWSGPVESDQTPMWKVVVVCLTFAHYFLAFVYSQRQLGQVQEQLKAHRLAILPILLLTIAGSVFYLTLFPLLIYFALHHVYSEVYLLKSRLGLRESPLAKAYFVTSFVLSLMIYVALLRRNAPFSDLPTPLLLACLSGAYAGFFMLLIKLKDEMSRTQLVDACIMELMAIPLLYVSTFYDFILLHVVCYHVVLWALLPIPRILSQPRRLNAYLAGNIVLTGAFVAVSPMGIVSYPVDGSVFVSQFTLWAYVHITTSVALSDANPRWLIRYFRPISASPGRA